MTRSRLVVTSALSLVVLAAGAAGAWIWLGPPPSPVGPVPAAALALPGDAPFLVGLDVRRLVASPLYERHKGRFGPGAAFQEIRERTGLDPERDVDAIVLAGARDARPGSGVAIVLGRFESGRLRGVLGGQAGVSASPQGGVELWSDSRAGAERVLAILDDGAIAIGEAGAVRATIDNRGRRDRGVASNPALVARLQRVRAGATLWMVGDESVLRSLPNSLPAPGGLAGAGGRLSLPALQQVVVSADLDPQLAMDVLGFAADEAGARNLADVLRGLIALFAMQSGRRPELQGLASAFNVAQAGQEVSVAVRLSRELVDALGGSAPAAPPAPGAAR
jgi:hypothetical protein